MGIGGVLKKGESEKQSDAINIVKAKTCVSTTAFPV